jgi:hypothetical protein
MKKIFHLLYVLIPSICVAQKQVITSAEVHLRDGLQREWNSFPLHAKDSQLVKHFKTLNVSGAYTLSLTQTDVNHSWSVLLNGKVLGKLVLDEKKMDSYYAVPQGTLNDNDNVLVIHSETVNSAQPDDILVANISLLQKPLEQLLNESSLNIHSGIPSRLTILNDNNSLQPVNAINGDTLATRCGVIYSGTGNFSFTLPAGKYKVFASRGFEYGVDSAVFNLQPGQKITKEFKLKHEVYLKDWVSVDTHVHTLEYSGHGDATMKERILTIAGEGLDYAVITEHNKVVDISNTVKNMKMDKWFTPIAGDELTTEVGHFNLFPASSPSPHNVKSWRQVSEDIKKNKEVKVVILNHARDVHGGFRPADSLLRLPAERIPANAMEVMNSGSQQTDPRQLYLDWLGLISRGIVLTPVGSSDSHDVSRFIVGQARTYVRKGNLVENFVAGKVGVSFGLFTELSGDPLKKNTIIVKVYAPSWIKPSALILFANGKKIHTSTISSSNIPKNNVYVRRITIPNFSNETIFVAVAEGSAPSVPWWPVAKPYQHESPEVNPIVIGLTGPVKLSR